MHEANELKQPGAGSLVNSLPPVDSMGEVVEITEQDSEATALELAEWALEDLGDELAGKLSAELAAINEPLAQEAEEQAAKARALRQSHESLLPRVAAQQRILAGEKDKALAEGRDTDAEAKRQESVDLERNLRGILAQAEACEQSAQELWREMQRNYRKVFQSKYPEIREACVATEIALCKILDKVWGGIMRYQYESGVAQPFVMATHKADMTPRERGPEAPYFTSLWRWFGGRR